MIDREKAIEAVAASWAGIDGRLDEFMTDKPRELTDPKTSGTYAGYMAEAEELSRRLKRRGYTIVPWPRR